MNRVAGAGRAGGAEGARRVNLVEERLRGEVQPRGAGCVPAAAGAPRPVHLQPRVRLLLGEPGRPVRRVAERLLQLAALHLVTEARVTHVRRVRGDRPGPRRTTPSRLRSNQSLVPVNPRHRTDGLGPLQDFPIDGVVSTVVGPGKDEKNPAFNEPAGLSLANGKLYVADTNAHRIRVIDLKTKEISTVTLKGVEPVVVKEEEPKSGKK